MKRYETPNRKCAPRSHTHTSECSLMKRFFGIYYASYPKFYEAKFNNKFPKYLQP